MLDVRIYRLSFLPAVLATVVVAFSFFETGKPLNARGTVDSFDIDRAFGSNVGIANEGSLRELVRSFPQLKAGSVQDGLLAARVAKGFQTSGFNVSRYGRKGRPNSAASTSDVVVGVRPGLSAKRIVILARRDFSNTAATIGLSGTALLLELARDLSLREQNKTIVLASVAGPIGNGSVKPDTLKHITGGAPVDLILVIGEVASQTLSPRPLIAWSSNGIEPPLTLVKTVAGAVRTETAKAVKTPSWSQQLVRRALPVAVSDQAPLNAAGLSSIMLQASGERGPTRNAKASAEHMAQFGRATLRVIAALDPPRLQRGVGVPEVRRPKKESANEHGLVINNKVLPERLIRLVAGLLLLPGVVAVLDLCLRSYRRRIGVRKWFAWMLGLLLPAIAVFAWLRFLGRAGVISPSLSPLDASLTDMKLVAATLSSLLLAGLVAALARKLLRVTKRKDSDISDGGATVALMLTLVVVSAALWFVNPYSVLFTAPAVHFWLFAALPDTPLARRSAWAFVCAGLVGVAAVVAQYCLQWGLNPLQLLLAGEIASADGHLSPVGAMFAGLFIACFCAVCMIVRGSSKRFDSIEDGEPIVTRGPLSYAGPGSLGGTNSALH